MVEVKVVVVGAHWRGCFPARHNCRLPKGRCVPTAAKYSAQLNYHQRITTCTWVTQECDSKSEGTPNSRLQLAKQWLPPYYFEHAWDISHPHRTLCHRTSPARVSSTEVLRNYLEWWKCKKATLKVHCHFGRRSSLRSKIQGVRMLVGERVAFLEKEDVG